MQMISEKFIKQIKPRHLAYSVILLTLAFFTGILFFNQVYKSNFEVGHYRYVSDLLFHANAIGKLIDNGELLPHPGFHIAGALIALVTGFSAKKSAVILMAGTICVTCMVIYYLLKTQIGTSYRKRSLLMITAVSISISAIFLPFFSENIYIGQGTPNIWHNPTVIFLRPFGLICFYLLGNLLIKNRPFKDKKAMLLVMILTAVTVLIKPNFAIVLIPAVFIYILPYKFNKLHIFIKENFKKYIELFLIFLPAVIILIIQYWITYNQTVSANLAPSKIGIDFLGVWSLYSPNPFFSVILGLAFPLSMALFWFERIKENKHLLLAWLMTLVGVFQFAFLAEIGSRYYDANWFWGYEIALQTVFTFSIIEFFKILKEKDDSQKTAKIVTAIVLLFHLVSGIYYFGRIFLGGTYF